MIHFLIIRIYKILQFARFHFFAGCSKAICKILFYLNDVKAGSFSSNGIPYIHKSIGANIIIGKNFMMNNGSAYADSGLNGKCRIEVRDTATLIIGNNVGMSDVTITCHEGVTIGNNVLLGVGSQVRDTDNHSLNPAQRRDLKLDWKNKKTAPITIQDNVFVGANVLILKGVTIGENSIIGAGSVVAKNIPANEIWAGNPAKFIRQINLTEI